MNTTKCDQFYNIYQVEITAVFHKIKNNEVKFNKSL